VSPAQSLVREASGTSKPQAELSGTIRNTGIHGARQGQEGAWSLPSPCLIFPRALPGMMGKENPPVNAMTLDDLVAEFGRPIPDTVFAEYLGVNIRTMRKHAHQWGGVEIIPGRYAFFEGQVRKVIENAKPVLEKRKTAMARCRDGQRPAFPAVVPRRFKGQRTSSRSVGGGRKDTTQKAGSKRPDDPLGFLDGPPPGD